jgi:YjbE family integral membrane protein
MEFDFSGISLQVILGILLVDILLSGDNAIVIALVCRSLPPSAQSKVMWIGILGAFLARLLLTSVASMVLEIPLIKLVGGLLLLKISVDLILDNVRHGANNHETPSHAVPQGSVWAAAKTIVLADIVMSLDNVLALSAVTGEHLGMLILGLVLSIPILMFGSIYISRALDRFPILLWAGAGILGGVAGSMLVKDTIFHGFIQSESMWVRVLAPGAAGIAVVVFSLWRLRVPRK